MLIYVLYPLGACNTMSMREEGQLLHTNAKSRRTEYLRISN